jgi:translocation and assembly module TamB
VLAVAAAVAAVALLAGLSAVSPYLNSDRFKQRIVSGINDAIDGSVSIEKQEIELFSGGLRLTGVQLREHNGSLLADIGSLHAVISWPALLGRTLHFKSIRTEAAVLNIGYDGADQLRLVRPLQRVPAEPRPTGRSGSWDLRIDDLQLRLDRLVVARPTKDLNLTLSGIELRGAVDSGRGVGSSRLSLAAAEWLQGDRKRLLESVQASFRLDPGRLMAFSIARGTSRLSATGRVMWNGIDSKLHLAGDVAVDLSELQQWVPEGRPLAGKTSARFQIEGLLTDPAISVQMTLADGQVADLSLDNLSVDLDVDRRQTTIRHLRGADDWGKVQLSGTVRYAFPESFSSDPPALSSDAFSYQLDIRGERIRPASVGILALPWAGELGLALQVTGKGGQGRWGSGKMVSDVRTPDVLGRGTNEPTPGSLHAELQWQGKTVEVAQTRLQMGTSTVEVSGRIDFEAGEIETARILARAEDLGTIGRPLGVPGLGGAATARIDCHGPLLQPTLDVLLEAETLTIDQRPFGRLLSRAQSDALGPIRITQMLLENNGSRLSGSGTVVLFDADGKMATDPELNLAIAAEAFELPQLDDRFPIHARINGRMTVGGLLRDPEAALELDESHLHWNGRDVLAQATAGWQRGRLTVHRLRLSSSASAIEAQGTAVLRDPENGQWLASPAVEANLDAPALHLGDLHPSIEGIVAAHVRLSGPVNALAGSFDLSGRHLTLWGQALESAAAAGRMAENRIYLDTLKCFLAEGQAVLGNGLMGFDRQFSAKVTAADIDLANIAALQRAYPVEGRLYMDIQGGGTIADPQLSAAITIRDPLIDDRAWKDAGIHLQLKENQLDVSADLNFNLKGQASLDSGRFNVVATFDHTDLTPYLDLVVGQNWSGEISGQVSAAGDWHNLQAVQGRLSLKNALFSHRGQPVLRTGALEAVLKDRTVDLPKTPLEITGGGVLDVSASGRFDEDVRFALDGRLPLAALEYYDERLEDAQGDLLLLATSQGPINDLKWQGTVTLQQIGFDLPGFDQPIDQVNGRLAIDLPMVVVEQLSGKMDSGQFGLSGQLKLSGLTPVQGRLTLDAQTLPLQWPETFDSVINARLVLDADAAAPILSGRVEVVEGTYFKDVQLNLISAVTQPRRRGPAPVQDSGQRPWDDFRLDVILTHRYPFLVDNNLARMEIVPDLKFTGTVGRPVVSGRAAVSEGEIIFRRKTFTVTRGVVDFINPYKIEPFLDLSAEALIRQWEVTLSLSGPPDALSFKLTSDPQESESDILSLILLGRTTTELNQGERDGQTTQQMLAALVATAWGQEFKEQSGVDILEVGSVEGRDAESADRLQVTVGKHLSRRLTVKYEVESGAEEMIQRAVAEYRLLEYFLASGFQDTGGGYGGELLYRIEF